MPGFLPGCTLAAEGGGFIDIIAKLSNHPVEGPLAEYGVSHAVVNLWVAAGLMLATFLYVAARLRRQTVPTGFANLFESVLLFLRDDVLRPVAGGHHADKFLPFIWTAFFFILFCNLIGLLPYAHSPTGNINVTGTLALLAFVFYNAMGVLELGPIGYVKSIVPGGLPKALLPLMFVVEVIGHLAKTFALAVRLFANMTGGHATVIALFGFIFMTESLLVSVPVVAGAVAIYFLELLVCLVQAYIYTFLVSIFVGMATHPEH